MVIYSEYFSSSNTTNQLHKDAWVKELIIEEEGKWNTSLVNDIFWEDKAAIIQPFSKSGREDQLY